ncbi:helix-turn-helix transcriptional regulator [Dyella japonica]|uniref:helix-turn-helix transcriptional regulator n=1 Tax=Dyella japonica TaxID=231455 RepID=UPI00037239B4|nr:helix-turn-helix domain-containing protein [Dyella japonica]
MPKIICSQFDEFERVMLRINSRFIPTKPGTHDWLHHSVDLGDVTIAINQLGSGTIHSGAMYKGTYSLFIPLSRPGSCRIYGQEMEPGLIGWFVPDVETYSYSREALLWLGITIEQKHILQWVAQQPENFLPGLKAHRVGLGNTKMIDELADLIKRALHVDAIDPFAAQPARCLETLREQVLDASYFAVQSVGPSDERSHGRPRLSRQAIIRKAATFIDASFDDSISVRDLCAACRVSSRTLHSVFLEEIGVSPHRYLMLKRLSAIHIALTRGGTDRTVASICAKYGVWDFGRFASLYRRVFGVLPSQALRQ